MRYHRCKCGQLEAWESGCPPQDCDICDKCGSTLSWSPAYHNDPIPHDLKEEWVIVNKEPKKINRCQRCHKVIKDE